MKRMRHLTIFFLAAAALALSGPPFGEDLAAVAQAPPAKVAAAGREPTLQLGGLLQIQADAGDRGDSRFTDDNDRFYLRRARLTASGRFLEELDFRLEVELAGSLGNASALRAQLTDAYATWNRYAAASFRMGQFKTPFGFEQLYADPRLVTIERSLANDRLTLSRQIGVQVGGDLLDKRLTYSVGVFNGNGANNDFNDNDRFASVGRVAWKPWSGQLFGREATTSVGGDVYASEDTAIALSGLDFDSTPSTVDRDGLFTGKRRGQGIDLQVQVGPFELWAEALLARFEPRSGLPARAFDAKGGYVQASYLFPGERAQLVAKRELFDPSNRRHRDDVTTDTLGFNYYIKRHDLKVMLDALHTTQTGRPAQTKVLARLQVVF